MLFYAAKRKADQVMFMSRRFSYCLGIVCALLGMVSLVMGSTLLCSLFLLLALFGFGMLAIDLLFSRQRPLPPTTAAGLEGNVKASDKDTGMPAREQTEKASVR